MRSRDRSGRGWTVWTVSSPESEVSPGLGGPSWGQVERTGLKDMLDSGEYMPNVRCLWDIQRRCQGGETARGHLELSRGGCT